MQNLTDEEIRALPYEYNLADGHAYRRWNAAEDAIIGACANMFRAADRKHQRAIESAYVERFFSLAKQSLCPDAFNFFLCFTASTALEVIGNFLRLSNLSVSLVEPCFDNLADILKRHHVNLSVFPDHLMQTDEHVFRQYLDTITGDAIFLVTPNNPTGTQLLRENLEQVCSFCRASNKLLILDTCFRFYLPDEDVYDQYRILVESGVDFIVVEDTGKTWPTLELKAPFFCASRSIADALNAIYTDFLLHVSPVSILLMTEFLCLAERDGRQHLRQVVGTNRAQLYRQLKGTFLEPQEASFASVSWLRITNGMNAVVLKDLLAKGGVHLLPGCQFYWSDRSQGDSFVRIALTRDSDMFYDAAVQLRELCQQIAGSSK